MKNTVTVTQIEELRALKETPLATRLKTVASKVCNEQITIAKIVRVLDERRDPENDKTLKKFILRLTGIELDSSAYKAAVAFGMVGEGHGTISEALYDSTPLRWLIVVSSILNTLAKEHAKNDILSAETRAKVAAVLEEKAAKGHEQLRAILSTLKPEEPGSGEGEGENEGGDVDPEPAKGDILTAKHFKAFMSAFANCENSDVLETVADAFGLLQSEQAEGSLSFDAFGALRDCAAGRADELAAESAPVVDVVDLATIADAFALIRRADELKPAFSEAA